MKKINLILVLMVMVGKLFAAPAITKTANKASAYIGEEITYTISVCGMTNSNQLATITDNLGPYLDFVSCDINTSPINSAYSIFCSGSLPSYSHNSVSNLLTINFPSCNFVPIGNCFSFNIVTKVRDSSCSLQGEPLTNRVTLNSFPAAGLNPVNSNISTVNILSGVPWTLIKNYRAYQVPYLQYDVRLNAAVGGFNQQVLFNQTPGNVPMFRDTFFLGTCMTADASSSYVHRIKDDGSGTILGLATGYTSTYNATLNCIIFTWSLPPVSVTGGKTLNSYLYRVDINVTNCTCPSTQHFDLVNKAYFNANDQCNNLVSLADSAKIDGIICSAGGPGGPSGGGIVFPSKDSVCVSKSVTLDNNQLGYTMPGCTGKYVIEINNCSNFIDIWGLDLTDIAPAGVTFGTPTSNTPGAVFSGSNSSQVYFGINNTITGSFLNNIVITIPFTVSTTAIPNSTISNCVDVNVWAQNRNTGIMFNYTVPACDQSFKVVPTKLTTFLEKTRCTNSINSCGPFTSNNFVPQDTVDYVLHFYNYGTSGGSNIILSDILPSHFSIINPATEVKVYTTVGASSLQGTCDPSIYTEITNATTINYNAGTRELTVNFGTNLLDPFTCSGVRHYFVKLTTKISTTAPNGRYNNAFKITYDTLSNLPPHNTVSGTSISNVVAAVVNVDNLIMYNKTLINSVPDCDKQTDTAFYEIKIANMGQVPIMFNFKDYLNIPSGVSLIGGIRDVKFCKFTLPITSCAPSLSFGSDLVMGNRGFTVYNQTLQPCEIITVRYHAVFNTALLPTGYANGKNICNKLILEAGFPNGIVKKSKTPMKILATSNTNLINKYFASKSPSKQENVINEIRKENAMIAKRAEVNSKLSWKPIGTKMPIGLFTPIWRDSFAPVCKYVWSCLNGIESGCINSNGSSNATFKITGISNTGIISSNLVIAASASPIKSIEFVLADIRMVKTCPTTPPWINWWCRPCSQNMTGTFNAPGTASLGPLNNVFIPNPTGIIKQKNAVFYTATNSQTMPGTYPTSFQTPVSSLNCGGRLEMVITAIITYKDCSVCYVSDAFKYNANFRWVFPSYGQVAKK